MAILFVLDAGRVGGGRHVDGVGGGGAGVVLGAGPACHVPICGRVSGEGDCFAVVVLTSRTSSRLCRSGDRVSTIAGVAEPQGMAILFILDTGRVGGGRHIDGVGGGGAGVVLGAGPACHVPIIVRVSGEGDHFAVVVLSSRATLRLCRSGNRVNTIAGVAEPQGMAILFVIDTGRVSGGRHVDGVSGGSAGIVFSAGPACHVPIIVRVSGEGDQFRLRRIDRSDNWLNAWGRLLGSLPYQRD